MVGSTFPDACGLLLIFGISPLLTYSGAIYVYWGLVKGKTLGIGHFGVRNGLLARVNGILYALFAILCLTGFIYSTNA